MWLICFYCSYNSACPFWSTSFLLMATVSKDQVSLVQTCRTSWQFPCGVLNFSWPSHLGCFRTHSSPNFPQRYLAAQEPFEPRIDLYYVRTIWIHLRSSSGPESWLPRKGPGEGVFLFFFFRRGNINHNQISVSASALWVPSLCGN